MLRKMSTKKTGPNISARPVCGRPGDKVGTFGFVVLGAKVAFAWVVYVVVFFRSTGGVSSCNTFASIRAFMTQALSWTRMEPKLRASGLRVGVHTRADALEHPMVRGVVVHSLGRWPVPTEITMQVDPARPVLAVK